MELIFNRESAEALKDKYTILELETFDVEGKLLEVFCVIPADKISLGDLPHLEHHVKLHDHFVEALRTKNYKVCYDLYEHLLGKFGGEVDSFYEEIIKRLNNEVSVHNQQT